MEIFVFHHVCTWHRDSDDLTLLMNCFTCFYSLDLFSIQVFSFDVYEMQIWSRFRLNLEHLIDLMPYLRCDVIYYGWRKG